LNIKAPAALDLLKKIMYYEKDYTGRILRRLFRSLCPGTSRTTSNATCSSGSTFTTTRTTGSIIDVNG
jgi:hypothetical protein